MSAPFRPEPNSKYPGNSDKKKLKPVAKAKIRKESTAKRVIGEIIREDARGVGEMIMWDVIIPTIKNLISDTVTRGIDAMLFGGSSQTYKRSETKYSDYSGYSKAKTERTETSRSRRYRESKNEMILDNRSQAMDVIDKLGDIIDQYGQASVSDLNDLVGLSSNFVDDNWGWTDPGSFDVRQIREGFLLKFEDPEPLKK